MCDEPVRNANNCH
uniref:U650w n=1 Tax=Mycobacterium leprae TaxID=1769 RepID=Q50117_MYCLR|nr:u650w [Mycobacterium leprae]